jgi:putative hydrolase of the HAD superfamily
MVESQFITTLFLDIGGVLLTNGWDREARKKAAGQFGLEPEEFDQRHSLIYEAHENGRLSLDGYLDSVIFYRKRTFSKEDFKEFMFAQSQPHPGMLELVKELKNRYGLKLVAVNNEGRELMLYRIDKFRLETILDFFVSSCFVHFRKPDQEIFRFALDLCQAPREQIVYIEDRAFFLEVAQGLGIRGIHHTGYETTRKALASLGLSLT